MASITDILKNAGIKITKRTKKIGQVLSDFGIDVEKGDIAKYGKKVARRENTKTLFDAFEIPKEERKQLRKQFNEQGLDKEEIYNALSQQTGKKPGGDFNTLSSAIEWSTKKNVAPRDIFKFLKKKTGQFKDTNFLEYGANRPDLFPKITKEYNLKYGAPSITQAEQAEQEAQQAAEEYYTTEKGLSKEQLQEQLNRLKEDYGLNAEEALRILTRTKEDIATQQGIAERKYKDTLASDALQQLQENRNLTADVNASGQWDSSLRGTRFDELGQAQQSRTSNIESGYSDYLNNLNQLLSRSTEDYTNTIGSYKRARNRGVFDLDLMERQRQNDFTKGQQSYTTDYLGDILNEYAQKSEDYYQRQNDIAADAYDYTKDYLSA